MAKPHEPPSHEAFQTQPMDVALLAAWPMMEEKEGVEGRGSTVMDSPSHNETRYHNESPFFSATLIVIKETYHGARTHDVALRSTTGDYHPPVHLSGYLALLRRMRRELAQIARSCAAPNSSVIGGSSDVQPGPADRSNMTHFCSSAGSNRSR